MPSPEIKVLNKNNNYRSIALDHITIVDANPIELADVAFEAGYAAICPFLHSMDVLPRMPAYNLIDDLGLRAEFIDRMAMHGLAVDISYPFTLSKRTIVDNLTLALDCAAAIKTRFVNVLVYDRDPIKRKETFTRFCDLAADRGLRVAVEFFPASQIATLEDALELVEYIGDPDVAGINVDLLHLYRSGGSVEQLSKIPPEYIVYAQLCDGPDIRPDDMRATEASDERQLPGEGKFDLRIFVEILPPHCPVSVEVPRLSAMNCSMSMTDRAREALFAARSVMGKVEDQNYNGIT